MPPGAIAPSSPPLLYIRHSVSGRRVTCENTRILLYVSMFFDGVAGPSARDKRVHAEISIV